MTEPEPSTPPTPRAGVDDGDDLLDPTFAVVAARAADHKGATDVLVLQVGAVLAITDHFVIASAPNPRLVRTVVEEIERQVGAAGGPGPLRVEGLQECEWVLADYGTFVAHVFSEDARRYYELERLWSDVPVVTWHEDPPASATGS